MNVLGPVSAPTLVLVVFIPLLVLVLVLILLFLLIRLLLVLLLFLVFHFFIIFFFFLVLRLIPDFLSIWRSLRISGSKNINRKNPNLKNLNSYFRLVLALAPSLVVDELDELDDELERDDEPELLDDELRERLDEPELKIIFFMTIERI